MSRCRSSSCSTNCLDVQVSPPLFKNAFGIRPAHVIMYNIDIYRRISVALWWSQPPGTAHEQRDAALLTNKKKVKTISELPLNAFVGIVSTFGSLCLPVLRWSCRIFSRFIPTAPPCDFCFCLQNP